MHLSICYIQKFLDNPTLYSPTSLRSAVILENGIDYNTFKFNFPLTSVVLRSNIRYQFKETIIILLLGKLPLLSDTLNIL